MKKYFIVVLLTTTILFAESFTLISNDLEGQLSSKQLFNGFGCSGQNISPALSWKHAPKGTKSFAITLYDPDAPTGSGWWHWVVFNIPNKVTSLIADAGDIEAALMPKEAIQSLSNYGTVGYGGACPPNGDGAHRYIFTVYALDIEKLPLGETAMPALVGFMISQHTIQKASLLSYYERF